MLPGISRTELTTRYIHLRRAFTTHRSRFAGAPNSVFWAVFLATGVAAISGVIALCGLLTAALGGLDQDSVLSADATNLAAAIFTFSFWLARAHYQGKPAAWTVQIILSAIGLLGFPFLTVIHGILLAVYCQEGVRRWYSSEPV